LIGCKRFIGQRSLNEIRFFLHREALADFMARRALTPGALENPNPEAFWKRG
jgi:hypothetical protein